MIHVPGRTEPTAQDFITLLRMACNLKLTNCSLLKFSFNIFGPWLTLGNCNQNKCVCVCMCASTGAPPRPHQHTGLRGSLQGLLILPAIPCLTHSQSPRHYFLERERQNSLQTNACLSATQGTPLEHQTWARCHPESSFSALRGTCLGKGWRLSQE